MRRPEPVARAGRVGYVLKMYPRFSETFVVTELLPDAAARRRPRGLLPPAPDRRALPRQSGRAAGAGHLPPDYSSLRASELWELLRRAGAQFGDLGRQLRDLLSSDVRDAAQALELARLVRLRGLTHLHAHFASVSADVARLAARIAGITYSITAHAKDIFHADVDAAALRRKLRDASDVITVSDFNLVVPAQPLRG